MRTKYNSVSSSDWIGATKNGGTGSCTAMIFYYGMNMG
jgi:hypothetical protein